MSSYAKYENPDYFDSQDYCLEHKNHQCIACEEQSRVGDSVALSRITYDQSISLEHKFDAEDRFEKQVNFIKTALDIPEAKLNKMKVKDLGSMMNKAQSEITVGKMKTLLGKDRPQSFTGKILFSIFRRFL